MSFKTELARYRDPKYGLLGDGINPVDPSGNALLYEAHAAQITTDAANGALGLVLVDLNKAINLLKVKPGLFRRKPKPAKDKQSHDDYIGVAAVSWRCADQIAERGEARGWFFDNHAPNASFGKACYWVLRGWKPLSYLWDFWHGRFPGFIQHINIAALQPPGKVGWLIWLASIWWSCRSKGNESGKLLDYLKVRTAEQVYPEHWATKRAVEVYVNCLNNHYDGNVSSVYAVYFGPTHPFALYSDWPRIPS